MKELVVFNAAAAATVLMLLCLRHVVHNLKLARASSKSFRKRKQVFKEQEVSATLVLFSLTKLYNNLLEE